MKKLSILLAVTIVAISLHAESIEVQVKVAHSLPFFEKVSEEVPYTVCRYQNIPVTKTYSETVEQRNPLAPALGAAIGSVIGHQFGGGRGKTVATAVGGMGGLILGSNHAVTQRTVPRQRTVYEKRRVCTEEMKYSEKNMLTGYTNVAYFKGNKIEKVSDQKLRYIPVTISW